MRPLLWPPDMHRQHQRRDCFCCRRAPDCCPFVGRRRIRSRDALAVRWGIRYAVGHHECKTHCHGKIRANVRARAGIRPPPRSSRKEGTTPWPCSPPTPCPIRRSSCPPSGAARRRPSPTPSPPTARSPDAWPPTDPTLSSSPRPTRRSTATGSSSPTRRRKLARWPPSAQPVIERVTTRTDLPFAQGRGRAPAPPGHPLGRRPRVHGRHRPRHLRAWLHFLEETVDLGSVAVVRMGLSGTLRGRPPLPGGRAIAEAARALGRRCVLVASGDMSHKPKEDGPYGFAPEATRVRPHR